MKVLRLTIFFLLFLSYFWVCPLSADPDSQPKVPFEDQTFKEINLEVGFYDYHALKSTFHPYMDEGIMAHIAAQ
ncbi:MAG: hypothetical protein Q8O84_01650, partial [Nanoarchaeota archaeon]|nr:hypothetical protein [Nanoarchaeota archaeon]